MERILFDTNIILDIALKRSPHFEKATELFALIDKKKIMNNTNQIAFNLFREWSKNAAIDYPENNFTIIDETKLVNDLLHALKDSVKSLVKEERTDKRARLGYDFGFIIGFIQGNLNKHWFNEYILKRTDLYKGYVINKAILEYLKFDDLTSIRINTIYENLLKEGLNLQSYDFKISELKIKKYEIDNIKINNNSSENITILTYLENRIKEQIIEIVEINTPDYLPEIDQFFNPGIIKELIKKHAHHRNAQLNGMF